MFQVNQNGDNNRPSINTSVESFYGDTAWLQVSLWDDKVSFKWTPCIGRGENGRRQYDKDNAISTGLVHPKISALIKRYEIELQAKVDAAEDPGENGLCVGVPVKTGRGENATTSGIFIEYKRGENGPDIYLTIAKNLTADGVGAVCRHKFDSIGSISGTSPEKGGFTAKKSEGDFYWFLEILKAHSGLARYGDHSRRLYEQFASRNGNNTANQASNNGGFDMNAMNSPDQSTDGFSVFN